MMAAEILKKLFNLQFKIQQTGEVDERQMARQRTLLNDLSAEVHSGQEIDVIALSDVCSKYMCLLLSFYSNNVTDLRANLKTVEEFFKVKKISRTLFKDIGKQIIETILDPSVELWLCNELVQFLNGILELIGKLKSDEFSYIRLYSMKLMDALMICGDYDVQFAMLELIFRLIPDTKNESLAKGMFPVEATLQKLFRQIDNDEFEKSARTFLNAVNETYDSVLSINAETVFAGSNKIHPMKGQKLWIDFNSKSETVSIVCAHLNKINNKKGYVICIEKGWIENIIFRSDLKNKKACKLEFKLLNSEKIFEKILKDADECTVLSIVFLKCSKVTRLRSDYLPNHYAKLFNREEWSQVSATDTTNLHIPNVLIKSNRTKSCSSNITSNVSFKSLEPDLMGQQSSKRSSEHEVSNVFLVSHRINSNSRNILISQRKVPESNSSNSVNLKTSMRNVLVNRNFKNDSSESMGQVLLSTTVRKKPQMKAGKKQTVRDRNCVSTLLPIPEQDEEKKTSIYFKSSKGRDENQNDEAHVSQLEQQKTRLDQVLSNGTTYLSAKQSQDEIPEQDDEEYTSIYFKSSKGRHKNQNNENSTPVSEPEQQKTILDQVFSNGTTYLSAKLSQDEIVNHTIDVLTSNVEKGGLSAESAYKSVELTQETENDESSLRENKSTTENVTLVNKNDISRQVLRICEKDVDTNNDVQLSGASQVEEHSSLEVNNLTCVRVNHEILSGDTICYSQQQLLKLTPSLPIKQDNSNISCNNLIKAAENSERYVLTANTKVDISDKREEDTSIDEAGNAFKAAENSEEIARHVLTANINVDISDKREENSSLNEAGNTFTEHEKKSSEHSLNDQNNCLVSDNISFPPRIVSEPKNQSGDCITGSELVATEEAQLKKTYNTGVSCVDSLSENILTDNMQENNSSKMSVQVSSLNKTTQSNENVVSDNIQENNSSKLDSHDIQDNSNISEQVSKGNDRNDLTKSVKCNEENSMQTFQADSSILEPNESLSMQVSSINKDDNGTQSSDKIQSVELQASQSDNHAQSSDKLQQSVNLQGSDSDMCLEEIRLNISTKSSDKIQSLELQASDLDNRGQSSNKLQQSVDLQGSDSDMCLEEIRLNISTAMPTVHLQRCKKIEMILEARNKASQDNEVTNTKPDYQGFDKSCLHETDNVYQEDQEICDNQQPELDALNKLPMESSHCLDQSQSEVSSSNKMDTGFGSHYEDSDELQLNIGTRENLVQEARLKEITVNEISEQKAGNETGIVEDNLPLETLNSSAEIADSESKGTRITIQAEVHQLPNQSVKEINEDVASQHYLSKDPSEDVRSEVYSEASKLSSMYAEKYINLLKEKAKLSPVRERSVSNDPYLEEVYNERKKTPRKRTRKLFNEQDLSYLTDNHKDESRNVENIALQKQLDTEELLGILESQKKKDVPTSSKNIERVSPMKKRNAEFLEADASNKNDTGLGLLNYQKTSPNKVDVSNVEGVTSHQDAKDENVEPSKKRKLKGSKPDKKVVSHEDANVNNLGLSKKRKLKDKNVTNQQKKMKTDQVFEIMGNLTNVVNGILDENQAGEDISNKKSNFDSKNKKNVQGVLEYLIENTSNIDSHKSEMLKSHRESRANKGRYFAEMFDCVVDDYSDVKFINRNVIKNKRKIRIPRGKHRFNGKHEQPPGKVNILQDIRILPDTTTLGSSNELLDYIVSDLTGLINKIYKFKGSSLGSTTI